MTLERRLRSMLDGTGPRSRPYLISYFGTQIEPVLDRLLERGVIVRRGSKRGSVIARALLIKAVEGELAYLRIIGALPPSGEDRKGV